MSYEYKGIKCDTLVELLELMRRMGEPIATPNPLAQPFPSLRPPVVRRIADPAISCAHLSCPQCGGTGQRSDGLGMCIHFLSCRCPRCSPHSMTTINVKWWL